MSLLTYIIRQVPQEKKRNRADRILAEFKDLPSRSQLKHWFSEGRIMRGEEVLEPSDPLFEGDEICIDPRPPAELNIEAREINLEVFFEDQHLIIINKPRGISMHPGAGYSDETTLVHGLLAHAERLSDTGGVFRPGIVHRLDKDTEGLVVVAKDNKTHEVLSRYFENREITRAYWALCYGRVERALRIEKPIGRHPVDRKKMAVVDVSKGRQSLTFVEPIQVYEEGYSWVRCKLMTGRTHQIRVHLTHEGHPLLNDPVYGRARKLIDLSQKKKERLNRLKGQALVAYELGFKHPMSNEKLHFEMEPPAWLKVLTAR